MSDERSQSRPLSKFFGRFALSSLASFAAFLVGTSVAWACGNATVVIAEGLFPTMIYVFGGALLISLVLGFFDTRREHPMQKWHRVWVGAAIVVMLTGAWTIYYGVTVDSDEWRMWDKTTIKGIQPVNTEVTFE